jgi:hypothetical protein
MEMATIPQHVLKHIRLQFARSKEFPAGLRGTATISSPSLHKDGHIDLELWRKHREACRVRRFWEGEDDAVGRGSTLRPKHRYGPPPLKSSPPPAPLGPTCASPA